MTMKKQIEELKLSFGNVRFFKKTFIKYSNNKREYFEIWIVDDEFSGEEEWLGVFSKGDYAVNWETTTQGRHRYEYSHAGWMYQERCDRLAELQAKHYKIQK